MKPTTIAEPHSREQCESVLAPLAERISHATQRYAGEEAQGAIWHQVLVLCDGQERPRLLGQGSSLLMAQRQAASRVRRFGAERLRKGQW